MDQGVSAPRTQKQKKTPHAQTSARKTKGEAISVSPCTECGKTFQSRKALFGHMRCHPERAWRGIVPPKVAREGQAECADRGVSSSSSSSNDDECCRCRSCRRSFPSGFELHRCDDGFGSSEKEFCVLDLNMPPPPHGVGGGGSPASSISDLC